jgi:excinuclease UvrABC helicase subunit UvrB
VKEINEIIINKESLELAQKMAKMSEEEQVVANDKIEQITYTNQERFETLIFGEHRELYKGAVGEFKYLETVEAIFDFFWKAFMGKKAERANTMISDLRKITGN